MQAPLIGITPDIAQQPAAHGPTDRLLLNLDYTEAIVAAGGIPIVLAPTIEPAAYLDLLDGLLLTGGGDVAPKCYGATTVHPETYGVSDLRDHFEMTLIRLALAADLPMLAICRGLQILNVALGGTLLQHIPDQLPHALNHRQQELGIPATDPAHDVSIRPETLLATILGSGRIRVNSYHHQAIADLATPLQLAATAPDGVIEAVELPHATFVLAVQWHPERLFRHHPLQAALFSALVDAARLKMRRRAARIP